MAAAYIGAPVESAHGAWDYVFAALAISLLMVVAIAPEPKCRAWWKRGVEAVDAALGRVPKWPIAVGLFALAARTVFLACVPPGAPASDAATYDTLARGIIDGAGYFYRGAWALYAPGYSLFIAGVYTILGDGLWVVPCLQLALGAVTCSLLYIIARPAGEIPARVASILLALSPGHILYTNTLRFETLSTFLTLVAVWVCLRWVRRPAWWVALVLGLVTGASILVRVPTVFLVPAFVVLAWSPEDGERWRKLGGLVGPVVLGVVVVIAPWTIRNYVVLGRFVPISIDFAHNFHLGNDVAHNGDWYPEYPWYYDQMPELEAAGEYARLARENARAAPLGTAWLMLRKLVRMVEPFGTERRGRIEHVMILYNLVLLTLVTIGMARNGAFRQPLNRAVLVYGALWLLSFALIIAQPRYRVPALPFACVLAGAALATVDGTDGTLAGDEG